MLVKIHQHIYDLFKNFNYILENEYGLIHGFGETEIEMSDERKLIMYYINDGVYGVLNVMKMADIAMPVYSLKVR